MFKITRAATIILIFISSGCLSTSSKSDTISIYLLDQRINRLESSIKEINEKIIIKKDLQKYDSLNLKIKALEKYTNEFEILEGQLSLIDSKYNRLLENSIQKTKELSSLDIQKEVTIVWITMKNKSRKPIQIVKDKDVWIGPLSEVYVTLPTEKDLKLLYSKN
jgi:hypothetical protein